MRTYLLPVLILLSTGACAQTNVSWAGLVRSTGKWVREINKAVQPGYALFKENYAGSSYEEADLDGDHTNEIIVAASDTLLTTNKIFVFAVEGTSLKLLDSSRAYDMGANCWMRKDTLVISMSVHHASSEMKYLFDKAKRKFVLTSMESSELDVDSHNFANNVSVDKTYNFQTHTLLVKSRIERGNARTIFKKRVYKRAVPPGISLYLGGLKEPFDDTAAYDKIWNLSNKEDAYFRH